jgi:hypothetical protein
MILLAVASRGSTAARWISAVTTVSVLVSVLGFVLFVDAIGGGPSLALGLGLTERVAFDTLTLWSVAVGLILLASRPGIRVKAETHREEGELISR